MEIAVSCRRCTQTVAKTDWKQANEEFHTTPARNRDRGAMNALALERWEIEGGMVLGTSNARRLSPFVDLGHTDLMRHRAIPVHFSP